MRAGRVATPELHLRRMHVAAVGKASDDPYRPEHYRRGAMLSLVGGVGAAMLNRSFWRGRKVFLTGHTGFKGSWLSLWLHALGAEVTGYALDPPTQPNLFEQADASMSIHSIRGDIRDFPRLKTEIAECRPEVVLHLAAQSVVRRGYEDPIETYSSNVMGTVHLFEALRQLKQPCAVVNVTSDKCYANREWVWGYREDEPMGGHDPYSNSKGCAELVTTAYRESFFPPDALERHGVALASARAGNAIGGGDWTSDQLIPDLMRAFLAGRALPDPQPLRHPAMAVRSGAAARISDAGRAACCRMLPVSLAAGTLARPNRTPGRCPGWRTRLVRSWGNGASWSRDDGGASAGGSFPQARCVQGESRISVGDRTCR